MMYAIASLIDNSAQSSVPTTIPSGPKKAAKILLCRYGTIQNLYLDPKINFKLTRYTVGLKGHMCELYI